MNRYIKPNCKPLPKLSGDLFQKVNPLKVPLSSLWQHHQASSPQFIANKTLNRIMELNTTCRTQGILSVCSQHHNPKKQGKQGRDNLEQDKNEKRKERRTEENEDHW